MCRARRSKSNLEVSLTTTEDKINRTYQLTPALIERLGETADRLGLWPSELVAALLRHALDDLEAGCWAPRLRPLWYTVADDEQPPK
jgi:hypothetical protein